MNEEILINIIAFETRVALVENGVLQEVYIERERSKGIVGNIYKGNVVRVLPGMQAAFVDIGLERASFLHVSDIFMQGEDGMEQRPGNGSVAPDIRQVLREGQSILVQVNKDPLGTKGARLTTLLSVPSRYLVLLPYEPHVGD
jgi:ribonuclease G